MSSHAASFGGGGNGGSSSSGAAGASGDVSSQEAEGLRKISKLVNSFLSRSDCGPFREPVDWRGLELYDYPKVIKKMMDLGTVKRKLERGQYRTVADCADDIRLIWSNCKLYNADGSDFYLLADAFSKRFEERYRKICKSTEDADGGGAGGTANLDKFTALHRCGASLAGGLANTTMAGTTNTTTTTTTTNATTGATMTSTSSTLATTTTTMTGTSSGSTAASGTGTSLLTTTSLEAKVQLVSDLFRLRGDYLGQVLQLIELRCPQALEHVPPPPPACLDDDDDDDDHKGIRWAQMEINMDAMDAKTLAEMDRFVQNHLTTTTTSCASATTASNSNSKSTTTTTKAPKRTSTTLATNTWHNNNNNNNSNHHHHHHHSAETTLPELEHLSTTAAALATGTATLGNSGKRRRRTN